MQRDIQTNFPTPYRQGSTQLLRGFLKMTEAGGVSERIIGAVDYHRKYGMGAIAPTSVNTTHLVSGLFDFREGRKDNLCNQRANVVPNGKVSDP